MRTLIVMIGSLQRLLRVLYIREELRNLAAKLRLRAMIGGVGHANNSCLVAGVRANICSMPNKRLFEARSQSNSYLVCAVPDRDQLRLALPIPSRFR
jgi:hypothetical protein